MFNMSPVDGRIVFTDTEFTTLDRGGRQVWEIGAVVRDPGKEDVEVEWQIRPDLTHASPDSLRIGRYYRRNRVLDRQPGTAVTIVGPGLPEVRPGDPLPGERFVSCVTVAACLAAMVDGATVVGAVISADDLALHEFMRINGQLWTPHYRIRCVETLALGFVHGLVAERYSGPGRQVDVDVLVDAIPPAPYDPKTLSRLVGVDPPPEEQHRALVDARWARDVWDAVFTPAAKVRAARAGR